MSNQVLEGLVKEKDYTFKKHLFKFVKIHDLSLDELLLIVYFLNQEKLLFDIKNIKEITYLDEKAIVSALGNLNSKDLLQMCVVQGADGKTSEIVDLTNIYQSMVSELNTNIKVQISDSIFSIFEKEFARPLSPMEYEIINAWLKAGINDELIIGALKEATYNGVSNLRYIDKIIYEWGKKGFKTMQDVNNHLKKKVNDDPKDLFDYNWLDEEE